MLSVLRAPAPLASISRAAIRPVMTAAAAAMTEEESFLFDLNGFLVVRGVFTAEEVAAANAAVDAHAAEELKARGAAALRNAKSGTPMAASGPRMDMGGMLWWQADQSKLFRDMLTHPRLVPYYRALCGEGYRMDHQPLLVAQGPDSEGFKLHGGPISGADGVPQGVFNPELQYRCVHGQLWTSLLAASVQLCDHQPGDGGFCIVRGSHKLNLPVPTDFADGVGSAFAEHIHHPATRAGDVVLWSEATVHGATPWRAERERRVAIYRFAPPNMGYGRGYLDIPPGAMEGLTPLQRAVLEPPYATRLERPLVTASAAAEEDGATEAVRHLRSEAKKEHDRQTLGTAYF